MKPYKNRPKIIKGNGGIKTSNVVATFGLPEVNVYPNNRWGDIARSQGLETARNWRKVKEGTTKGINDFGAATASTLREVASYTPIIGDVQDTTDVMVNIQNKDYINAGLAGIGFLPFIGNPLRRIIDYKNLKKFVDKYNYTYPKVSPMLMFSDKLDKYVKHFADRHNTFIRGTHRPDIANITPNIPEGGSNLKSWESGIYTSNSFDTARGYAGNDGGIVLLKRPYTEGKTLSETLKNADDFSVTLEPSSAHQIPNTMLKGLYNIPKVPYKYKGEGFLSKGIEGDRFRKVFQEISHKYDLSDRNEYYRAMQEAKVAMNKKHNTNIPLNNEVRLGMVGNKSTNQPYYRHYIFVSEPNTKANLEILETLPSLGGGTKAHTGKSSMQLSRKYKTGGQTLF